VRWVIDYTKHIGVFKPFILIEMFLRKIINAKNEVKKPLSATVTVQFIDSVYFQ